MYAFLLLNYMIICVVDLLILEATLGFRVRWKYDRYGTLDKGVFVLLYMKNLITISIDCICCLAVAGTQDCISLPNLQQPYLFDLHTSPHMPCFNCTVRKVHVPIRGKAMNNFGYVTLSLGRACARLWRPPHVLAQIGRPYIWRELGSIEVI